MGLFGKMFEKKVCSVCGGEIGMLGNRKLEDGNLCKKCAAKLSPWFTGRRGSTVDEIKAQLDYREDNRRALEDFNPTTTLGGETKVILDEDNRKFVVTRASNFREANADIIEFGQVTGVNVDIDEDCSEEQKQNSQGEYVSYNPPRYIFSYSFKLTIHVNHPYFDEISFDLAPSDVQTNPDHPLPMDKKPDPMTCREYKIYKRMGREIREALTEAKKQARDEAVAANAPKSAVVCKHCGATTIPDRNGCCEYCGISVQ